MHSTVIMCQGMAFSVAMNSKRSSALVALLIASNFVEIKGGLTWQDLLLASTAPSFVLSHICTVRLAGLEGEPVSTQSAVVQLEMLLLACLGRHSEVMHYTLSCLWLYDNVCTACAGPHVCKAL